MPPPQPLSTSAPQHNLATTGPPLRPCCRTVPRRFNNFGGRTVHLKIDLEDWSIRISEDLLVSTFPGAHHLLTPHRKSFKDDSRCPLCSGPLDFGVNALAHCTGVCMNNFHVSCLEKWLIDHAECPECECKWKDSQDLCISFYDEGVDRKALSMFVGYAVHRYVALEEIPNKPGARDCEPLIRSFMIAKGLLDETWAKIVLQALLEAVLLTNIPLSAAEVTVAYGITNATSRLREAIIRAHSNHALYKRVWDSDEVEDYPIAFIHSLAISMRDAPQDESQEPQGM